MRIAILADIHGNLPALRAVMDDVAQRGVSTIVNLGDCASGPLWAGETVEVLRREGWPTVRGNHDRELGETAPGDMYVSDRQAYEDSDGAQRAWLAALPFALDVAPGVRAFHARPDDDAKYLIEDILGGHLVPAPAVKVARRLGNVAGPVVLVGHSHRAAVTRLADGRTIVNPGSVGQPAYEDDRAPVHRSESGSPFARYAILDMDGDRFAGVALAAVPYDFEPAALRAAKRGRPEWAHALRTGFMPAAAAG